MQEWVDTLRSKLREMKILSPKENLYSKLPEVRPPLLPTRDPMSPLPETPAIPAAIPGVERISTNQTSRINNSMAVNSSAPNASQPTAPTGGGAASVERTAATNRASTLSNSIGTAGTADPSDEPNDVDVEASASGSTQPTTSNALSHSLLKLLYPATKYSQHANDINIDSVIAPANESSDDSHSMAIDNFTIDPNSSSVVGTSDDADVSSLARTFANNVLSEPAASSTPKRSQLSCVAVASAADDDLAGAGADATVYPIYPTPEPLVIPRPQTSRSIASKKNRSKSESSIEPAQMNGASATNITIIQVSSTISEEQSKAGNQIADDHSDTKFTNNVQIIPSNYVQPEDIAITTVQVTSNATANVTSAPSSGTTIAANHGTIASDAIPSERLTERPPVNENNTQKFTGVTNISIGITDRSIVQQIKTVQPEQMHYEQVFVAQIPTTTAMKASGDDQQIESGLSKELHVNRIKLSKPDTGHTSADSDNIEPSTSHTSAVSATITFSIATSTNSSSAEEPTTNSNTAPVAALTKSKEVKNKAANEESASSRRPLLTRGLTEAVIVRPSRKDVARPNALGNQVNISS